MLSLGQWSYCTAKINSRFKLPDLLPFCRESAQVDLYILIRYICKFQMTLVCLFLSLVRGLEGNLFSLMLTLIAILVQTIDAGSETEQIKYIHSLVGREIK